MSYHDLAAAVIVQAIVDYQSARFSRVKNGAHKNRMKHTYLDAKDFLFTNRLETFLEEFYLDEIVKPERVRACANGPMITYNGRMHWNLEEAA